MIREPKVMRNAMESFLPLADKAAIGLSFLCALHCLLLPVLLVLSPSLVALGLQDEAFHFWLVFVVLPISIFALTMGCKDHKQLNVLVLGFSGLVILTFTALFGHDLLGEWGEKVGTLIGAAIIAVSHVKNFALCQQVDSCECPENS